MKKKTIELKLSLIYFNHILTKLFEKNIFIKETLNEILPQN